MNETVKSITGAERMREVQKAPPRRAGMQWLRNHLADVIEGRDPSGTSSPKLVEQARKMLFEVAMAESNLKRNRRFQVVNRKKNQQVIEKIEKAVGPPAPTVTPGIVERMAQFDTKE